MTQKELLKISQLAHAFDQLSDHVVITDVSGKVIYVNKAVEKNTGFHIREVLGKKPGELWGGHMPKKFYQNMWKIIKKEKKPFVGEVKNKRKDGSEYWQELRISPVLNSNGHIRYFIGIEPNITERKEKEKLKEDLTSILGHESLTPITSTRWILEWLLERGKLSAEQRRQLQDVYRENQRLINIVNDLLFISQFGHGHPRKQTVYLEQELGVIINSLKEQFSHVRLVYQKAAERFPVHASASLVRSLFSNIIQNACQYSGKNGKVIIALQRKKDSYVFVCKDNGIGITPKDKKRIFSRFFRAENAKKLKPEGSGLGLFIAKMVSENFGWNIHFESALNQGTTFFVSIPIKKDGR